jgi:hypothetical protein
MIGSRFSKQPCYSCLRTVRVGNDVGVCVKSCPHSVRESIEHVVFEQLVSKYTVKPGYKNPRYKNTLLKTSVLFLNSLVLQGYFLVRPTTFAKNNLVIFLIFPGPEHILISRFDCRPMRS